MGCSRQLVQSVRLKERESSYINCRTRESLEVKLGAKIANLTRAIPKEVFLHSLKAVKLAKCLAVNQALLQRSELLPLICMKD